MKLIDQKKIMYLINLEKQMIRAKLNKNYKFNQLGRDEVFSYNQQIEILDKLQEKIYKEIKKNAT